jgi:diadenylate cyclase
MDLIYYIRSILSSILRTVEFWDIIDIGILAYLIYKIIKFVKGTRAGGLVKGIIFVVGVYFLSSALNMKVITFLMNEMFGAGLIAIVVLFQPELRRSLEMMGRSKISKLPVFSSLADAPDSAVNKWGTAIEAVCDACQDLSSNATGALIVIERETKLGEQIDTGTVINAMPSKEIFGNIFFPKTPLHDGAVIMRDGMILAAACFLPNTQKDELINKTLGSRHRAAIGMSESSDALVIAVSEETGTISVAENGELTRGLSRDSLKRLLRTKLLPEKSPKKNPSSKKE